MSNYTLGINASGYISSACILKDGKILAAAAEERFTRIKRDQSFPHEAIKYCLKEADISFSDLDVVSSGWNPAYYMSKPGRSIWQTFRDRGLFLHYIVNELGSADYSDSISTVDQQLTFDNTSVKVEYIDHHLAHSAYSFYFSGFESSLVVVLDGFGDVYTGGVYQFSNNSHQELSKATFPHSIGMVYSTFTQFLGFSPNHDEWRVMALAALGDSSKYKQQIKDLIKVGSNSYNDFVELDLSYFDFINFSTVEYYSKKFETLFGVSRKPNEPLTQQHYDIASGLQAAVEERVLELLNYVDNKYSDEKNLCLSGGFFMNSALNGKIYANTNFNDPHIGPCPDDTGISVGTAFVSASKINAIQKQKYFENYFGSKFSNEEIKHDLDISKIHYEEIPNYLQDAAKFLANGKIIGWFQGRSELGQRALGNRSILASPTFSWMKDEINKFVKFREEFRPFAPSILDEYKEDFFEIPSDTEVYFMEKVVKFKDSVIEKVPAVVHNDGTGRIHTVSEKSNKIFYNLLKEFHILTDIPILLNTSFNTNNVPIVDSPRDALSVFYNCGLDVMYLNNIRILK